MPSVIASQRLNVVEINLRAQQADHIVSRMKGFSVPLTDAPAPLNQWIKTRLWTYIIGVTWGPTIVEEKMNVTIAGIPRDLEVVRQAHRWSPEE